MTVNNICKNYFRGFHELYHFKQNSIKTNLFSLIKIFSYCTVVFPVIFGAMYGASSLFGRVRKDVVADKVHDAAKTVLIPPSTTINAPNDPMQKQLQQVLETYSPHFRPNANYANLIAYIQSDDFKRHAQTARIYYNANQLSENDALRIISQREPTNIAMGPNQYNEYKLKTLFGYTKGIYNNPLAAKSDGSSFQDLPNTAAAYAETYLWNPPGGNAKKEIACLSLPAPALDSKKQPHYAYYMHQGQLDSQKYEAEMEFLFKTIETAVRDNKDKAFNNSGLKRLVLTKFGQGAFLEALSNNDKEVARNAYKKHLAIFLERIKDLNIEIVMSDYSKGDAWHEKTIIGDIIETAASGDLIINAWDPHSAPGNGNDADKSFDGAMGKASGILLTQTSWLNETLKKRNCLAPVN